MTNAERLFNAARRLRDWETADHTGEYAERQQLTEMPGADSEMEIIEELFAAVAAVERERL